MERVKLDNIIIEDSLICSYARSLNLPKIVTVKYNGKDFDRAYTVIDVPVRYAKFCPHGYEVLVVNSRLVYEYEILYTGLQKVLYGITK